MSFILLLEDDSLQVKILTDLIKYQLGVDVVATDSPAKAMQLAQKQPELIISDISLEKSNKESVVNKDGIIFSQFVKSNPETWGVPLILRSSMPLTYFGTTFEDTKANIFLDKSTSNAEFLKVVAGLLYRNAKATPAKYA